MITVTDEEIVEAVMMCSVYKGYALYREISEVVGLSQSALCDRIKKIEDVERTTGNHGGQSMTFISLPDDWPNEHF